MTQMDGDEMPDSHCQLPMYNLILNWYLVYTL